MKIWEYNLGFQILKKSTCKQILLGFQIFRKKALEKKRDTPCYFTSLRCFDQSYDNCCLGNQNLVDFQNLIEKNQTRIFFLFF